MHDDPTATPCNTLQHTATHCNTGIRYLLVTQNGQLVGILKKKDILEHIELFRKGLSERREDTL